MEIGSFIKMQRTKQKMTLSELADGIVSVSYLSKIENLKTEASPQIIQLLCNRLGIELDKSMDEVIEKKCNEWFEMLLHKEEESKIVEAYEELQELLDSNLSNTILLFEIHKIRYYLVLGKNDLALEQINKLNKLVNNFGTTELYYWYKFRGNYNTQVEQHKIAIERYLKAEELTRKLELSDEELADLQYTISVCYSKLRNTLEAIEYANEALDTFMKKYNFLNCARCHIVLGISYRRIKMYDKAIENYNIAKQLAGLGNNHELIRLTNQNLGFLYATQGKNKEAIKYYLEIVDDENINLHDKIAAMTEMIKVYYDMDEMDKVSQLVNEAIDLLEDAPRDDTYEFYDYVVHTYYYSLTKQTNKLVSLVKNHFIPFLMKRNDYANIVTFSSMLAKYYENIYRYKDATKYYKLANQIYKEIANL